MPFAETGIASTVVARTCGGGEAWGVESLALDFPGGPYLVEGLDPLAAALAKGRYGALCGPCGDACFTSPARVRFLRPGARDLVPMPEPHGGVYDLGIAYASGTVRLAGRSWEALLRTGSSVEAEVFIAEAVPDDFVAVLENTLRVMAAYRLFEGGGVLLHSAGVVSNGRASLFVGRSGAGKTTFARRSLAEGREVLSDDLNAVLPGPDGLRVRRVPFAGELGPELQTAPSRDVPLAGIYALARLPDAEAPAVVSPLPAAEAFGLLFCAASGLNGDRGLRDRLLETLPRLLAGVPRGRVAFSLRGPVWSAMEEARP